MANINVQPETWTLIFDESTDGSFRLINFRGRLLRATSTPSGAGGITVHSDKTAPSEMFSYASDGTTSLYVYNKDTHVGLVEKDI